MKVIFKLFAVCLLSLCTACASTGSIHGTPGDAGKNHRLRNTLITVVAAVVVGAIIANQAENNVRDVIRPPLGL